MMGFFQLSIKLPGHRVSRVCMRNQSSAGNARGTSIMRIGTHTLMPIRKKGCDKRAALTGSRKTCIIANSVEVPNI